MGARSAASEAAMTRYGAHLNPAFMRLLDLLGYGRVFERARGMQLWDVDGGTTLDFLAGFGSVNLGHNPPRLVETLCASLRAERPGLNHIGPPLGAAALGEALAARVPGRPRVLLSLSGGEAVESALKLARAATGRRGLLGCEGGFHGTGLGALSLMGHARFREPFEPLIPGCVRIPFGDLGRLERALRRHAPAAFLVEPIQAEGGVRLAPAGYLRAAATLCRRHGTLFVLDEVQTGLGRTGTLFAFEQELDEPPDVLVLGKALGGSMVPIAAAITSEAIHDAAYGATDRFDLHGSTFSEYELGSRAALETLAILEEEGLAERAMRAGGRLLEGLRRRLGDHPLVLEVRGRGLL
ncbi:MAG: aspartate aminotransferase family protein, partial [Myxococcales bacterium]|nr:aspartate aminotransferase family protein [Myxococcales bacterium]